MAVKAYLICPVRQATEAQRRDMEDYVQRLEEAGTHEFHLPHRDVDQSNDDGGVRICEEHAKAILQCDEVHVWIDRPVHNRDWNFTCQRCRKPSQVENEPAGSDLLCQCKPGLSVGSHFDLGMAYIIKAVRSHYWPLKFVLANPPIPTTSEKSFINVLRSLVDETV